MSQPMVPPTPPAGSGGAVSQNRTIMIVLSYLGILALIPLLVEKDDKEVQWHAKHGLVLFGIEFALFLVLGVLTMIPVVGCIISVICVVVGLGVLVLHVLCIMKAIHGERFLIPGISDLANRF